MMKLDNFIGMMTGCFDNKEQFNMMQATGKIYPYAKHVNTVCNDKINNIPHDFKYYLWPIPQSEIYKNKRLVQNPGWQAID